MVLKVEEGLVLQLVQAKVLERELAVVLA